MTNKDNKLIDISKKLIIRLHRQRPLRAGSLLVTILGDAIAPRGGGISLGSLIKLTTPFDLPERLVRTSIARLAQGQWVESERVGRSSMYRLTEVGRARFAEATERIYSALPQTWDGAWTLVLIPPSLKMNRDDLREELGWLGFGQLAPGLFAHPMHGEKVIQARLAELESVGKLIVMQQAVVTTAADAQLIAMGWDLDDLSRRYRRFIELYKSVSEALSSKSIHPVLEESCFILRTLLLHEYRKIHLRDPLLPLALLPDNWAGVEAYELCRKVYAKLFSPSERYLTATAETMDGPLPSPTSAVFARFGGLPKT